MADYIDREALLKRLCEGDPSRMEDFYYNAIAEAPAADVVNVVRCKDCEYGREEDHNTYSCANFPDGIGGYISGECFCSYGERKEN